MSANEVAVALAANDRAMQFAFENTFYLLCKPERLGKLIAHYELFKRTLDLPGALVECGVFKGSSLMRFAMMREILGNSYAKPIVAFDTFDRYFPAEGDRDTTLRWNVVDSAGEKCASVDELRLLLRRKRCDDFVDLVAGDICETVPAYVREHPELKISLLNLDVDFYPAAKVCLEHLFPRVVGGGILLLDDFGVFEGETRAVDEYKPGIIRKFPFAYSPCYVEKKW